MGNDIKGFLKIPMEFVDLSGEELMDKMEQINSLGTDPSEVLKGRKSILYVNPNQIVSFNESSEGYVTIDLSNGEKITPKLKFVLFIKMIERYEARK